MTSSELDWRRRIAERQRDSLAVLNSERARQKLDAIRAERPTLFALPPVKFRHILMPRSTGKPTTHARTYRRFS